VDQVLLCGTSKQSEVLFTSGGCFTTRAWGMQRKEFVGRPFNVDDMAISRDAKLLAVAKFASIEIWEIPLEELESGSSGAESPEWGDWDYPPLRPTMEIGVEDGDHGGTMSAVCFSPDSSLVAASSGSWTGGNHVTKVWSLDSESCVAELQGHSKELTCVQFAPSTIELLVATGSEDRDIRLSCLENADNGAGLRVRRQACLRGHIMGVRDIRFSCDAGVLVSGASDGTVKLWRVDSGALLRTLPIRLQGCKPGDSFFIESVDFFGSSIATDKSSKNARIAASTSEGVVCVWQYDM